jgi:PAS domain S-box-containing protein
MKKTEPKSGFIAAEGFHDIDSLRNKVIDYSLTTFAILGTGTWLLLISTSFRDGFSSIMETTIHTLATATLLIVSVNRKRLSMTFKTMVLIIIIVVVTIANFYGFGLFANAKIFVAVFPIFLSFVLPFRKALLSMALFIFLYAVFGYLFSTGILTYNFDLNEYASRSSSWIIGIAVVIFASMGLLLVGNFFNNALISNYITIGQQQEILQEKEKKYRLLFESSNDAIFIMKDYKYYNCNNKTFLLFGDEEILNKYPWELSPEYQPDGSSSKQKAEEIFHNAMNGTAQIFDWQHQHRDGSSFDVSISLNTIDLDNTTYVQAIMRDITEQKRTEDELNKYRNHLEQLVVEKTNDLQSANEELQTINDELITKNDIIIEQKNELEQTLSYLKETQKQLIQSEKMASIGVLTSGIAHEINNPINFISSGVVGLEMEVKEIINAIGELKKMSNSFDMKTREKFNKLIEQRIDVNQSIENIPKLMDSIRTGVNRTIDIVKGLRTFSRMDDEKKHSVSLKELIQSSLTILHNKYKDRIEVHTNFCEQDNITCFPGKLGQLFLNLIMNSVQAIENKGLITITTEYSSEENNFRIIVEDNGSGIPAEIQHKIFDPFYTSKPVGQGTGLGLSISHGIVVDHNGEIKIESEVGKGTKFIVTLPKS